MIRKFKATCFSQLLSFLLTLILAFRDVGFCCLFRWMNWWDRSWLIGSWLWIKKKAERARVLQKYSKPLLFTWIYWTSERLPGCLMLHIVNEETENDVASACNTVIILSLCTFCFWLSRKRRHQKAERRRRRTKTLQPIGFLVILVVWNFAFGRLEFSTIKGIVHAFNYYIFHNWYDFLSYMKHRRIKFNIIK